MWILNWHSWEQIRISNFIGTLFKDNLMQWQDVMNFTQQHLVFHMQEGHVIRIMIYPWVTVLWKLLVCVQLFLNKVSTVKLQPKETEIFLGSDSGTKRMQDRKKKNHDCTCPQFSSSNFQWTWLWGLSFQTGKISAVQIYASHRKNTSVAPNTIPH